MDLLGPCTNVFLTAYAHVRTEPQCDIGQTRGKKKPSTLPDSTVNPGGSASAPAGMVSGNGGDLNTGTDPCVQQQGHKAYLWCWDWTEFKFRSIASIWDGWWPIARAWKPMGRPAVLPAATPVAAQEPDKLEAVDRVATQLPSLECHQVF